MKKLLNVPTVNSGGLEKEFKWSPFSILDTNSSIWREKVLAWNTKIGDSTLGRGCCMNATPDNLFSTKQQSREAKKISTFDPFLAELLISWFSRPGDRIYDPFAGGNVRGAVSAYLGRYYIGVDISEQQVEANRKLHLPDDIAGAAEWVVGDGTVYPPCGEINMVLTCPPYFNMEIYSGDERDLSNQPNYHAFLQKYEMALKKAAESLAEDSFFVIVVSEVRIDGTRKDFVPDGIYCGLVPDTIKVLQNASLLYYNEIIVANSIGSLPMRVPAQFRATRKVGRRHQNCLVFYKGNPLKIKSKFGTKII